jgi:hypothetical protein
MTHRTALGKNIDMSTIVTRNETVRAVGNMGVNARGDVLNSNNEVITDATLRASHTYGKTVSTGGTNIPLTDHVPLVPDEELTAEELALDQEDDTDAE